MSKQVSKTQRRLQSSVVTVAIFNADSHYLVEGPEHCANQDALITFRCRPGHKSYGGRSGVCVTSANQVRAGEHECDKHQRSVATRKRNQRP